MFREAAWESFLARLAGLEGPGDAIPTGFLPEASAALSCAPSTEGPFPVAFARLSPGASVYLFAGFYAKVFAILLQVYQGFLQRIQLLRVGKA